MIIPIPIYVEESTATAHRPGRFTAHHINMNGRSYRPTKRPKPTQEAGTD